jgi:Uma2 family endonuclease
MRRYDILDGEKVYMTNPNVEHQDIQGNVYAHFRALQRGGYPCRAIQAPCDVLIRRRPLRTRQPDVLFISLERFGNRSRKDPPPFEPAPELVVEVLSPSETKTKLSSKLKDYSRVGVLECWVINPTLESVEILSVTPSGTESIAIYSIGETVQSSVFSGLTMDVAAVFES